MKQADVDIDISTRTNREDYGIRAIIYDDSREDVAPHPSGVYVDSDIPVDKLTGRAAIDYKEAEKMGYFKVDLLTNTSYNVFRTKDEVISCAEREPNWKRLLDENFSSKLPQLGNCHDLLCFLEPKSIDDLADLLALMRPAKLKYVEEYVEDKEKVRKNLYKRPSKGAYFKKSHAYAYALMIVTLMNKYDILGEI